MEDGIEQFQFAEWRDLPSSLTVAEVAIILRLDEDTVRRSAAAGGIPARRVGRQWRFSRDALCAFWQAD
jgi:excisionase family DNA binding protein